MNEMVSGWSKEIFMISNNKSYVNCQVADMNFL